MYKQTALRMAIKLCLCLLFGGKSPLFAINMPATFYAAETKAILLALKSIFSSNKFEFIIKFRFSFVSLCKQKWENSKIFFCLNNQNVRALRCGECYYHLRIPIHICMHVNISRATHLLNRKGWCTGWSKNVLVYSLYGFWLIGYF